MRRRGDSRSSADSGAPLVEVQFSLAQLAAQRASFRRHALAVAALPLVGALLLSTGPLVSRRAQQRGFAAWIAGWSLAAAALVVVAAVALFGLARVLEPARPGGRG